MTIVFAEPGTHQPASIDAPSTAYERIVDKLHDLDLRPHISGNSTTARCPSHDDRNASFAVYDKGTKAKVKCFAGCDDALDILPALSMTVRDLFNERQVRGFCAPGPEHEARRIARASMTLPYRVLDDLTHRPNFAESLCKAIGRGRPELYLIDKHGLPNAPNSALLTDPGYRHIAHLIASDSSDASRASDSGVGGGVHA